jgi:hypothetical protein
MTTTAWATRVLATLSDEVRRDLAHRPIAGIGDHFGLNVRHADSFGERGAGGWCDGVSILDSGVILYRPTPSRRENFTLIHELGHHLVDSDIQCLAWIADQPDPPRVLEQVCDQIAADLLIPADVLVEVLAGAAPNANAVHRLYEHTEASRSACAIAIARKLPCDGFVLLVEEGISSVFFATRARDTRPYGWRGDTIPRGHPLRQTPPPPRTLAWWPHPSGIDRREYFMSTATDGGWTVAVFAENNLFEVPGFHIPEQVAEDRGYDGEVTCPCGYSGRTRWWPCAECGQPQCPKCGECDCERRDRLRVACTSCFVKVQAHLIIDGLCDQCR